MHFGLFRSVFQMSRASVVDSHYFCLSTVFNDYLHTRIQLSGQWPFDAVSGRRLEYAEIGGFAHASSRLEGRFQRFDLIAERKDKPLHDWLRAGSPPDQRLKRAFLVCVSCGGHMADKGAKIDADDFLARREDALLRGASRLTEGEIRRLVGRVEHSELHWLVDDPDDPMLTRLIDLGGVVHCRGGMEDFRLIHSFQKVAIGQSAFQWWAAFLGAAREIYFPPIDRGIWSHPEPADLITDPWWWGIDLRVPNDERYIYGW